MIHGYSWRNPWHVLACGFGTGLAPVAPGTFGTVIAVPIYLSIAGTPTPLYVAIVAALALAGIPICGRAGRDFGDSDHGGIVYDEIVGFLVTMTAAPSGWLWTLTGFALFRLFDITKPWPVRLADRRVHGGLGVMLDDLLAGLYALLALQFAAYATTFL